MCDGDEGCGGEYGAGDQTFQSVTILNVVVRFHRAAPEARGQKRSQGKGDRGWQGVLLSRDGQGQRSRNPGKAAGARGYPGSGDRAAPGWACARSLGSAGSLSGVGPGEQGRGPRPGAGASRCPADAWRRPHTWPGREGPSKDREAESPGTLRVRRLLQGGVSIMAPPCPGFAVIKTPLTSRLHLWIPARVNAGKSSSLSSVPYTQTYNILNIPNLCKNWLSFPSFLIKDLKDKT